MPVPSKPKQRLEELSVLKRVATAADAKSAAASLAAVANDVTGRRS